MTSIALPIFRFRQKRNSDKNEQDEESRPRKKLLEGKAQLLHQLHEQESSVKYDKYNEFVSKVNKVHQISTARTLERYNTTSQDELIAAAIKLQRVFRGYCVRNDRNLRKQFNMRISETALENVMVQVCLWIVGFKKLFHYLVFLTLLLVTSYYQTIGTSPAAKDVNWALLSFFNDPFFESYENRALQPILYMDLLEKLVTDVYDEVDNLPYDDTYECHQLFLDWCSDAPGFNVSQWTECRRKFYSQKFSDGAFIDGANRINYGIAIVQTRSEETECDKLVNQLNPYRLEKNPRPCVTNGGIARVFKSDSFCLFSNCSTIQEFQYNHNFGGFAFMLNAGNFGMREQDMLCRVNQLRKYEWLDYRTRSLKFVMFTFNKNGDPRIGKVQREFTFDYGGKISFTTTAAALPPFEMESAGFGLSIFFAIYSFVFFFFEFGMWQWVQQKYLRMGMMKKTKAVADVTPQLFVVLKKKKRNAYCGFFQKFLIFTFTYVSLGIYFAMFISVRNYSSISVDHGLGGPVEYLGTQQSQLQYLFSLWEVFFYFVVVNVVLVLARCISLLNFHPSAAKIGGTFDLAMQDLSSFLLVFLLVVFTYTIVGMLLIGRTREYYGTFPRMLNTLLLASIGEVQDFNLAIFVGSPSPYAQQVLEGFYFWSFVIISTILLFNILLAIVVDAFITLNQRARSGEGFLGLWTCFGLFFWVQWDTTVVFWGNMRRKLRCCCKKKENENQDVENHAAVNPTAKPTVYPLHELILIVYQRKGKTYTTMQIREYLNQVLRHSPCAIELMISRMRYLVELEKLQIKARSLRGLNVGSEELQGYQLYLLEHLDEQSSLTNSSKRSAENSNNNSNGKVL